MDREQAERLERELRKSLTDLIEKSLRTSGVSKSALALQVNIARETLRRNVANGDLTIPQLYRIAPLIGGDFFLWMDELRALVEEVAE